MTPDADVGQGVSGGKTAMTDLDRLKAEVEQMHHVYRVEADRRVAAEERVQALEAAIQEHREGWQSANGIDPGASRPADMALWAVLDA
jgi:hypothetical protein